MIMKYEFQVRMQQRHLNAIVGALSHSFPLGLKRAPDGDFKMRVIRVVLLVAVGTLLSSGIVENPLPYCRSSWERQRVGAY